MKYAQQLFNSSVNPKPVDGYGHPIEQKKEPTDPNSKDHYGQMGAVVDDRNQPSKNPNYGQNQQMQQQRVSNYTTNQMG